MALSSKLGLRHLLFKECIYIYHMSLLNMFDI